MALPLSSEFPKPQQEENLNPRQQYARLLDQFITDRLAAYKQTPKPENVAVQGVPEATVSIAEQVSETASETSLSKVAQQMQQELVQGEGQLFSYMRGAYDMAEFHNRRMREGGIKIDSDTVMRQKWQMAAGVIELVTGENIGDYVIRQVTGQAVSKPTQPRVIRQAVAKWGPQGGAGGGT